MKPFLSITFVLIVIQVAYTQGAAPLKTEIKLAEHELEWSPPSEEYRIPRYLNNRYQDYDFGLQIRREKLEVRYHVISLKGDGQENTIPHLKVPAKAMHLADNDQDVVLSSHQMDPALIDSVYHADWAQTFFFQPKGAFSSREHCQMTAFFREGVALVYVFLLFDEPPASLPLWGESMRFRVREEEF